MNPVVEIFTVEASDGHRFEVSLYRAAQAGAPLLVFLPALGTPGKVYRHLAAALTAQGVQVALTDWRGMASSSMRASRGCDFGYRELVEIDAPALLAELAQRAPGAPLLVGGHSLGGQLGALTAATQPPVRALVAVASGTVSLPSFSRRLQHGIRLIGTLAAVTGPLLGYFPGARLGFGGREARTLMRDWFHVARTGRYQPVGSAIDFEAALSKLTIPALTLNFERDTWAPVAAADKLRTKLSGSRSEQWVWGDAECGGNGFDHYSWIRQGDRLAPALTHWIRSNIRV